MSDFIVTGTFDFKATKIVIFPLSEVARKKLGVGVHSVNIRKSMTPDYVSALEKEGFTISYV